MANAENKRIHAEFDLREEKTENLIRQQQQSYDLLMTMHIERDVLAVSNSMQDKFIKNLIAQNESDERCDLLYCVWSLIKCCRELKRLQEEIVMLKSDIINLQELNAYKKNLIKDVGYINQEVKRVKKLNSDLREETIALCHDLLNTGLHIANKGRYHQSTLIAARIGRLSQSVVLETESTGADVIDPEVGNLQVNTKAPDVSADVWEPLQSSEPFSPPQSSVEPRLRHSNSAGAIAARTDPDDIWRSDTSRNTGTHYITAQVGRRQRLQASTSKTGNSISSFYTIQKVDGQLYQSPPKSAPQVTEGKSPQMSSSFSMMY